MYIVNDLLEELMDPLEEKEDEAVAAAVGGH